MHFATRAGWSPTLIPRGGEPGTSGDATGMRARWLVAGVDAARGGGVAKPPACVVARRAWINSVRAVACVRVCVHV
jgi:hypothetical protein